MTVSQQQNVIHIWVLPTIEQMKTRKTPTVRGVVSVLALFARICGATKCYERLVLVHTSKTSSQVLHISMCTAPRIRLAEEADVLNFPKAHSLSRPLLKPVVKGGSGLACLFSERVSTLRGCMRVAGVGQIAAA